MYEELLSRIVQLEHDVKEMMMKENVTDAPIAAAYLKRMLKKACEERDRAKDKLVLVREFLKEIVEKLACEEPCVGRREPISCDACLRTDHGVWCAGCLARRLLDDIKDEER